MPFFDGIQVERVVQDEELPIEDTVLNTAVALSTIFAKNDTTPDHIQFDEKGSISLLYGDITVQLGRDEYLEDKMMRVISILPQIRGQKGILHLENVTDSVKTITFRSRAGRNNSRETGPAVMMNTVITRAMMNMMRTVTM